MLHTSGGIQVFRAADRSLSTYQYKSFLKIIKRNRGKGENFFSRENKFSPSPRTPLPLSKKAVFPGGSSEFSRWHTKKASLGDWLDWGVFFSTAYQ